MLIYLLTIPALVLLVAQATVAGPVAGAELYQRNCAVCHGLDGDGGVGVPLNLKDFLAAASDDYLRLTLREGRPGRVMPAFSNLSDAEVEAIIQHIRSWSGEVGPDYAAGTLQGRPERGATLFAKHCAACHGDKGQGGTHRSPCPG